MKKIAIVYYSQTGNTEAMAGVIEDYLKDKADVSVIDPAAFGPDDMDAFASLLWNSLNEENKVSLFVRYIDIETGKYETRIINKNK